MQNSIPTVVETLFLLPMTILFLIACIPITLKVIGDNREPANAVSLGISLFGLAAAAVLTVFKTHTSSAPILSGALVFDQMATFSNLGVLAIAAFTLLMSKTGVNTKGQSYAEHCLLVLLSSIGMMILNSSADLMVAFVGLEIMSISLYILIGIGHEQLFSKEAAFKYFILGSFASAIFLYGIALMFGTAGTTSLAALAGQSVILSSTNVVFLMGLVLLLVGIAFKVSLFPFHTWTPDVYQGAPTPISAFMATGVKLVMFTVLIRIATLKMLFVDPRLLLTLKICAVLTMTVGNISAIIQDNVKRILAYSSIAHAGYIMVGIVVAATSKSPDAAAATLFYLITYSAMNIGAFAVVNIIEKDERGNLSIDEYAGVGYRFPILGVALTIFILSLAGIPPMAGFLGKFYIFAAAVKDGHFLLAIAGVINSLLSVYYYLRILVYLYMKEETRAVKLQPGFSTHLVVAATMVLVLVMGLLSATFYEPAMASIKSLFS